MKLGPLTFQWACLHWVWRSMQSASRAFSSSATLARVAAGRSFLVGKRRAESDLRPVCGAPASGGRGRPGAVAVDELDAAVF